MHGNADAEYLEFVATLEKEPELLPSADNQVSEAKDAPQKKRVTPLMQFLHDKWTGKHHVSAPKQPQSRQVCTSYIIVGNYD